MIKIENTQVVGLEAAIRGMRNPMNSWEKSDSIFANSGDDDVVVLNPDAIKQIDNQKEREASSCILSRI